jgi:hypothetical protein
MPERRELNFDTPADVIADVERLRGAPACDRCGNWTLEQACWHLNIATNSVMDGAGAPRVPNTPEQDAMWPALEQVFATGKIRSGVQGPPRATPPADAPPGAVDEFIATLRRFEAFPGPFGAHRLFGNLSDDQVRRLTLIHAAHHLSHFVPKSTA